MALWPSGLLEKTQSDHHRQKRCSTSGPVGKKHTQSDHHRQTNKVFYRWPTICPPQADRVFYKWPTLCPPQTDKQGVLQVATICPPQADKQDVLQVAYNLTTTGKKGVLQVAYNLYTTDRQTGCSTSGLHSDHPRQTRQGVLTYRLALARGLVLGAIHTGDGHLLACVGRSQLFPGRGQSLAVATPVHSRITHCCNTAATPVHSRITHCCNTAATPVHSTITHCCNTAATPVHSRITQCYNTVATPVHSRITQCYNTAATPVHSRITVL